MLEPNVCAHFPVCGGCKNQHLSYLEQVNAKKEFLEELFAPLIDHDPSLLRPLIPAQKPWRYRNKMEFSFSQDKAGHRYLGLYRARGRNRVENLTACHLVPEWFSRALDVTRHWWEQSGLTAYHPHKNLGNLRTLTLREGKYTREKMAILTVSGHPEDALHKTHLNAFTEALCAIDPTMSLFLRIHLAIKGQPTQFFEHVLNGKDHIKEELMVAGRRLTFKISPSAFFQPNSEQAQCLFEQAIHLLDVQSSTVLLDLYCGTGTLGILFAPFVKRVTGIELNPYAVFDAKENARLNNLENIEFVCADVGAYLQKRAKEPPPDVLIVDPPRTGLDAEALSLLQEAAAKHILYISCNPKTQVRDLALLSEAYTLSALQPVDQFPHTPHVENIALLKLKR